MGRLKIRSKAPKEIKFRVFPLDRQVPEEYFWVQVAECLSCLSPINLSNGSHQDEEAIQSTIDIHAYRCGMYTPETRNRARQKNLQNKKEREARREDSSIQTYLGTSAW